MTLTATNVGRQPITITSFAMLAPDGKQLIEPRSALVPLELPVHVPPGDERSFHYEATRVNRTLADKGLSMSDLQPAVNRPDSDDGTRAAIDGAMAARADNLRTEGRA